MKAAEKNSAVAVLAPAAGQPRYARSLWRDALAHLLRDRLTLLALAVLLAMTLASLLLPLYVENVLNLDVNRTNIPLRFKAPGEGGALLGTDHLGRDHLLRLVYGGQISLAIAYSASLVIIVTGGTLGMVSGYFGGVIDDIIMWVINILSSVPPLFILLVASALWEPSPTVLILILAALGWFGTCRLVRGEVLSIRERDYVLSAKALGASNVRLLFIHIFPNVFSLLIVTGTIIAGNLILIESGLSYLGVGVQPPTPTWGNMLTDSRNYFVTGVHLVVWPGILIMITVLCFYLIGDGLRDALDPRRKHGMDK
ncbi:MAG: ABC transporter permease [Anaerolineae bacterium]|nr:ABC transporter permease [Anaerolineae bacterium]NUQ06773.1 ABC transporter permease [Anaerolineae bacterium]